MLRFISFVIFIGSMVLALPTDDLVISKLGFDLRYQYMRDADGVPHLVDGWLKASDVANAARYNPDLQNSYHLFTRENPLVSQPLFLGNEDLVRSSNFNSQRRTIYLIHGWVSTVRALLNEILVPAFLEAENVNVIAVDWGVGAMTPVEEARLNTVSSGLSGARFINWLNSVTGASSADYHLVGFSLGVIQAAVVGRNVDGTVPYISALDPANTMIGSEHFFAPDAGTYTEAIHTSSEEAGYGFPLAHVDFYPDGGNNSPNCEPGDSGCNHDRCFFILAESLKEEMIGRQCATYEDARAGTCNLPGTLRLGGLVPKTGSTGLFYLRSNAALLFSSSSFLMLVISLFYLLNSY